MKAPVVKALTGFIVLFGLYHGAEYAILYKNSSWGFLGFQFLFFISAWLIGRWQFGTGLSSWGLDRRKYFLMHLLMGMVMGIPVYEIILLIIIITGAEVIAGKLKHSSCLYIFVIYILVNFFPLFTD